MGILIINQGWTDNLGDQAIKKVLEERLKQYNPVTIPFAPNLATNCSGIGKIIALYHLDRKNRMDFTRYISKLTEKPRAVVIGGGELFAPNINFNSAFVSWIRVCNRAQIPVYVYGVSGDKLNALYSYRTRHALKGCTKIFVRDQFTKKLFLEHYKVDAKVFPDVVFTYGCKRAMNQKKDSADFRILCNILDYNYYNRTTEKNIDQEEYFDYWCNLIEASAKQNTKVYVGTTTQEDSESAQSFTLCLSRLHPEWRPELYVTNTLKEYWNFLDQVDCVISARMHAMILAVQKGCYCVSVCFKTKLEVFEKEYHNYLIGKKAISCVTEQAEEGLEELCTELRSCE